jgi:hypothetical protein
MTQVTRTLQVSVIAIPLWPDITGELMSLIYMLLTPAESTETYETDGVDLNTAFDTATATATSLELRHSHEMCTKGALYCCQLSILGLVIISDHMHAAIYGVSTRTP